jgi:redox-sensing transcriptional repressor
VEPNPSNPGDPDQAGDDHTDNTPSADNAAQPAPEPPAPEPPAPEPPAPEPPAHELPQPAVGRLSLYYRELHRLIDAEINSVNSQQLGRLVDVSPAVVRRDLSALGTIGRRGVGYDVTTLLERIGTVLGSGVDWKVVLVGVGSLGDALLRYRGFERLGFTLVAAFDNDPSRIGDAIGGVQVQDVAAMDRVLAALQPELAILAVPADQATDVASRLVAAGISGVLNFAPTTLRLPAAVAVVNVDLASELQLLAFRVRQAK